MVTLPELNLFLVREVLLDMKSSARLGQLVRIYVTSYQVPVEDVMIPQSPVRLLVPVEVDRRSNIEQIHFLLACEYVVVDG